MKRNYNVFLKEILVGHLTETDSQSISFRFTSEYLQMIERPILSQSFEDNLRKIYVGKKVGDLPVFFANLTPEEGELRDLIEKNLLQTDDLSVLDALGHDLPGAVIITLNTNDSNEFLEENGDLRPDEINIAGEELTLGFSLAGVQLKFSVSRAQGKLTLAAHGNSGDWIVKVDSARFPRLVENEFVIMEWARASGFDVPECCLECVNVLEPELHKFVRPNSNVFTIRRYDRISTMRIHQEDFAQVVSLVPRLKYDYITYEKLAVLVHNIVGEAGYYELIKRLTFIIASGNTDAHLKNWSLIYPDGINARLSPLYDQVFTLAWEGISPDLALKFAGLKYIRQIDEEAFGRLAQRAKMNSAKTIAVMHECLEGIVSAWATLKAKSFLPPAHLDALNSYWTEAALLKPHSHKFIKS